MDFSRKSDKSIFRRVSPSVLICTLVLLVLGAFFLFCKDDGGRVALRWLLMIFTISFLMRPFLCIKWIPLWDNGFGLSFGLGLGLSFLLAFWISSFELLAFGDLVCIGSLLLLAFGAYFLGTFSKLNIYQWDYKKFEKYILGFTVFAVVFAYAFWVIGFNGQLDSGTENYMDYAFMQSIYRQELIRPFDVWFSGQRLNYYYLGQAACVYMTRLSFTTCEYGYNLSLATFWGMVFVMTYEIAYGVVAGIYSSVKKRVNVPGTVAGLTAAFYSAFAANGHWLVYGILKPVYSKITGAEEVRYWFPDGTVYINTDYGDLDNGKNEFPAYSAILGDLHAHVINVIFVLPLVALLIDYAFSKDDRKSRSNILMCAILLGLYKGSNFWDFAIYFVITGAVIVFCDISEKGFSIKSLVGILVKAVLVTAVSSIVILPFTLGFEKMASVVKIAQYHSPIYKQLVLWLFPIAVSLMVLILLYLRNDCVTYGKEREGLTAFVLCTIGLIITPEVLYVEDIYGEQYARFNTMFKLTYQAFILFGIIVGIGAGLLVIEYYTKKRGRILLGIICFITILLISYTPHGVRDWFGDVANSENRKGISNLAKLDEDRDYYMELKAADIINQDPRKIVNILEAAGDSYTHNDALSVLTGTCTVSGWFVHEWMWRNNSEQMATRSEEVRKFYEDGDISFNNSFIDKYSINYIFIGPAEYDRYSINRSGIDSIGRCVWSCESDGKLMELIRVK